MDAQVTEHGVGFPAAKQHDGLGADVGTEQGGRAAWTQRTGGDLVGEDAGGGFVHLCRVLDGVGDAGGLCRR